LDKAVQQELEKLRKSKGQKNGAALNGKTSGKEL